MYVPKCVTRVFHVLFVQNLRASCCLHVQGRSGGCPRAADSLRGTGPLRFDIAGKLLLGEGRLCKREGRRDADWVTPLPVVNVNVFV